MTKVYNTIRGIHSMRFNDTCKTEYTSHVFRAISFDLRVQMLYALYTFIMQTLRDLDVSVLITSTPVKSKVTDINAMIDTD